MSPGAHQRPQVKRWRCLVKGCRQFGEWSPLDYPGADRTHYLENHYHPGGTPAAGITPTEHDQLGK